MKMKGFTLLEVLIAISIFLVFIIASFAVMDVGRSAWLTGDVAVELRQEMSKAFMYMDKELRETRPAEIDLASGSSSASLTFKIPQDNDDDGTILDSNGNIEWSGDITYTLDGSGQVTRTSAGTTEILGRNIIDLEFTRPASPLNLLAIDITAQKTSKTGRVIQDSDEITVKMRN